LACEQLAGDGFYKTNTATEEIAEIVVADAFYAFFVTRSFGQLNRPGIAVLEAEERPQASCTFRGLRSP